jgi:hypothetical protein
LFSCPTISIKAGTLSPMPFPPTGALVS